MSNEEKLSLSGTKDWYSTVRDLSLASLKKLKDLNLSHCDIRELPAELGAMSDLESLDLSGNRSLHVFPASLCHALKKLKVLNLMGCDIQELPAELGTLSDLESLDLSQNKSLHVFPASACVALKKLKVLNLSGCDIQELPADLGAVSHLESLDLSWNRHLRMFPSSACTGLKKLKVLNLERCDIQELPEELSTMSDLENLDLSSNLNLHLFPASGVGLKKLKVLKLGCCDIWELPEELSTMSDLENLDLSFNKNLHMFPTSACVGLRKLKVLDISFCNIQELPPQISALSELESLMLAFNTNLHLFPASACVGLKKLKVLNLSGCDIQELPAELSAMHDLEILSLSGNRKLHLFPRLACVGLKTLSLSKCDLNLFPTELCELSNLESLDLSQNHKLQSFPASACVGLKKLKVLNLSLCDIQELPVELSAMGDLEKINLFGNINLHLFPALACVALKKLKALNLSGCRLQELPAELSSMGDLESLDLSLNKNLHLFSASSCVGLKNLKVLNLNYCGIKELPAELGAMSNLEILQLSFNENLQLFPASSCLGLRKLKGLNLSHCDMQELPAELSEMENLEELDLSYNMKLHSLPESVYTALNNLRVLDLLGCDIQNVPEYVTSKWVGKVPGMKKYLLRRTGTEISALNYEKREKLEVLGSIRTDVPVPRSQMKRAMKAEHSHSLSSFGIPKKLKKAQSQQVIRKKQRRCTHTRDTTEPWFSPDVLVEKLMDIPLLFQNFSETKPKKAKDIAGQLSINLSKTKRKSASETDPISQLTLAVGPEGGTARVGDMSLYVPRGAVEQSVTLSSQLHIVKNKYPPVDSAKDEYTFSPVLSLHPHGHQFKQPVLVRCPFNAVPGGWLLVLLRANCQKSDPSLPWEEIVVYNTDTGEVSTNDYSYDISRSLLSITHFCDHCWTGKPLADYILGRKQLHCSAFGYVYNKQLTIEVIVHDRCDDIFEDIRCRQLQKEPPRRYFDGPEVFAVDRSNDVNCEIKSQSWEADEPMQTLPPTSFWSSWFGNKSKLEFNVKLKSGISRNKITKVVVNVSTPANAIPVKLTVAPPLDEFEPLPRRSLDSGMSDVETPEDTCSDSTSPTGLFPDSRPLEAARRDGSGTVDAQVINIVAKVGRDKWREIGRELEFTDDELMEYERVEELQEKLHQILYDWTRRNATATTEQLLDVCDRVRIGGIVRRQIRGDTGAAHR